MMMTYTEARVCLLLQSLLLLGAGTLVHSDEIPLIQWEADCDNYQVTSGVGLRVYRIHVQHSTPLAPCRSLCTSRTDCGGFVWWTGNECYLFNINDHIIEQVAHVSQNWYWSSSSSTWYSKSCGYSLGATNLSCTSYTDRVYDNQSPSSKWRITYAGWIPYLTATECQAWCGLYTGCRSVTYRRYNSDGRGECRLYSTTIQDLLDSGLTGDVIQNTLTDRTYTTYDRYCAGGQPYIPGTVSNNEASCGTTGADVTVTLPSSMRDDDVILYVADSEGTLYDQCQYKFTGQQVAFTSGRLTVTVDYLTCGAHITDEWLTLNSSLVAALQHSHSEQMFSIYHFYCHVARVDDRLDSEHYTLQETEGSRDVISETVIDDVTNDNDVTFMMVAVDVDDVIVADDDLAIRITSNPVVPFKVYDCSMVSSVIDDVRVTILDDSGCESNGARSNVTSGWAEITFPVKQIPFVDQVYFSCHVSTCVTGNCAQSECDESDEQVDVIREVSDVGAGPVPRVTINLLTPHFTVYKL